MKFAILGPDNLALFVRDVEPAPNQLPPRASIVEVTDEQATTIQSGREAHPKEFYFIEDGQLLTLQDRIQANLAAPPKTGAEEWISKQEFSAVRLVSVMDLERKLAAANKESAKLSAVRVWLDAVIASFALNPEPRNDWPEAPFKFEETVQEAISVLAS